MGGKVFLIGIMIMFLYGELVTYVRKDYLSMLFGSHIGYICCELCFELVTYVRKDYLSMLLWSHIGYIGCELLLKSMVNWLHMSIRTTFLCCYEVTLVTWVAT